MFTEALKGKVFDVVADTAHELGVRAFVIGGYVRDFFLQRPCNDIDIVVEGSGIALAEAVAHKLHTKVTVFKRFGTAMLRSGIGSHQARRLAEAPRRIGQDDLRRDPRRL